MTTCLRASVVYVPTCQKRANFSFLRVNVPINLPTCHTACQFFNLECQRAKRGANFSNIPLTKCYILLSILFYYIKNSTLYLTSQLYISNVYVSYIKTVSYFISMLHAILKENVSNFYFLLFFVFCSLVRNYNIKRPDFYTLQVTGVFSNFPQLKQLTKIKNTCMEYCDLLELRSHCTKNEVFH